MSLKRYIFWLRMLSNLLVSMNTSADYLYMASYPSRHSSQSLLWEPQILYCQPFIHSFTVFQEISVRIWISTFLTKSLTSINSFNWRCEQNITVICKIMNTVFWNHYKNSSLSPSSTWTLFTHQTAHLYRKLLLLSISCLTYDINMQRDKFLLFVNLLKDYYTLY
jgi:hypothetical protein